MLEVNYTAGTYPTAVTHIRLTTIIVLDNDNKDNNDSTPTKGIWSAITRDFAVVL